MRRILLGLMIALGTLIGILLVLLFIRKQNYYQFVADYTQFSSAADVQIYLNQRLEVGKSTEADVVAFILQSGIASKITPNTYVWVSNCSRGEHKFIGILCQVRAPEVEAKRYRTLNIINNLFILDYYFINFEFEDGKLRPITVNFFAANWLEF